MDHIVQFCPSFNLRYPERCPVNSAVRADFNIIADDDPFARSHVLAIINAAKGVSCQGEADSYQALKSLLAGIEAKAGLVLLLDFDFKAYLFLISNFWDLNQITWYPPL